MNVESGYLSKKSDSVIRTFRQVFGKGLRATRRRDATPARLRLERYDWFEWPDSILIQLIWKIHLQLIAKTKL